MFQSLVPYDSARYLSGLQPLSSRGTRADGNNLSRLIYDRTMGVEESAPLLSQLSSYAVALGGGAALIALARLWTSSSRAGIKKIRFSGRPKDEANQVFRDSTEGGERDDGEDDEGDDGDVRDDHPQIPYLMKRFVHGDFLLVSIISC